MADGGAPTCSFAEFSSNGRTGFSHLRGGSYNRMVVQEFSRGDDRDTGRAGPFASLGMLMPTLYLGLCTHLGNTTAEVESGQDTLSRVGCRLQISLRHGARVKGLA